MCFSATASFVAAGTIGTVGGLTLREVKKKSDIPLASLPLLFAIQQLIEGIIWLSFGSPGTWTVFVLFFSLFALVLWPTYVPLSVFLVEKNKLERIILGVFVVVGLFVSIFGLVRIIQFPITAEVTTCGIDYLYSYSYPTWTLVMYAFVVFPSCMMSSSFILRFFGLMVGVSLFLAAKFYGLAFVSVWCFFAAILSMIIYFYFERR